MIRKLIFLLPCWALAIPIAFAAGRIDVSGLIQPGRYQVVVKTKIKGMEPTCRLTIRVADKAEAVILAGAAGGVAGEVYRLTNTDSKSVGCTPKSEYEIGSVVLAADTLKHRYSVRFTAFKVEMTAAKKYEVASKATSEGAKPRRGKTTVDYTVHAPAIVIHGLKFSGANKVLSGKKRLKVVMRVKDAMGVHSIKFPKKGRCSGAGEGAA